MILTHDNLDCEHVFPQDWRFGGATGLDPRADPRWMPSTYYYYNAKLEELYMTQEFWCDDVAIDFFTVLASKGENPKLIGVKRPGETKPKFMLLRYQKKTDTVWEVTSPSELMNE